jgi:hypothetical protein
MHPTADPAAQAESTPATTPANRRGDRDDKELEHAAQRSPAMRRQHHGPRDLDVERKRNDDRTSFDDDRGLRSKEPLPAVSR